MTDTKLREAARALVAAVDGASKREQRFLPWWLRAPMTTLRAALDEPPEQAPEPAVSTYADGIRDAARIVESMPWLADGDVVAEALVNIAAEFKGTSLAESSEPAAEQPPECTECDGDGKVAVIGTEESWTEGCSRCGGRGYVDDMPDDSRCLDAVPCPDCNEQAPEPTEGDRARAIALLDALAYDHANHANHPDNLEESIRTIHEHDATARAQGEATGVEAERAAVTGYLEALARSERATDWSALDGLLLAAKDIEHALHTRGAHPAQKTSPNIPREDGKLESNIAILRLGIERDERRLAGARHALHHYLCELDGEPCNCVECRKGAK